MKSRVFDAHEYQFQPNEAVFLDTNIWLYLKPPTAQPAASWNSQYSMVFARLLKVGAKPIVDTLVLSEYLNTYTRIEYRGSGAASRHLSYKAFRCSSEGKNVLCNAGSEARQILKLATYETSELSHQTIEALLDDAELGAADFNDCLIAANCQAKGWKLLTNDADLISSGIDILTLNKRLLKVCRTKP